MRQSNTRSRTQTRVGNQGNTRWWRRTVVLICIIAMLAGACSGSASTEEAESREEAPAATAAPAATSVPEPTATETPVTEPDATPEPSSVAEPESTDQPPTRAILSQAFLTATVNEIEVSDGTFLFASIDPEGETLAASNGVDAAGNAPGADDRFRIGSITKVFTSLATLTLVEEGLVDLEAPASEYVSRVAVPDDVTVRDLLQHTSGLYNITDTPGFFEGLFEAPDRVWTPEEQLALIADRPVLFDAGSRFGYSNTNYVILGVLLEEVTGQPYHQVIRERISGPLDLSSTYVAGFEDGPDVFDPYEHEGDDEYDYTSIASVAWSAGGMVSSAVDLHTLATALFDDQIVSADLVAEMTDGAEYGLGLELRESRDGLYGHSGAINGYFTFLRHEADTGITAFLALTDSEANPGYAIGQLFEAFATELEDEAEAEAEATTDESENVLGFESCGQGSECAVVTVPLDYSAPDGDMTEIHVTRHQATGDRVGALFLNPGGPGGAAEDMIKGISQFGPPDLIERFDLIGIDPRGTGQSGPVICNANWEEDIAAFPTVDDGLDDDIELHLADFVAMADVCETTYGIDYLASLTTENAARDMETVRIALGGEPLNYLGYSYGTAIGSVYATLFPDTIRSMILDSAVPTDPAEGDLLNQAIRIEEAFVRLDRSCELWPECAANDVGLLNAIEMVRAELEANGAIGPLNLLTFNRAVSGMTAVTPAMPDVAQGLVNAIDGDGGLLNNIGSSFLTPLDDGGFGEVQAAFPAIICADGWNMAAATEAEVVGSAAAIEAASLTLGLPLEIPCDLWPVSGDGIAPVNYTGDAPILVIGNTYDPITAYAFSEQLAVDLGPNATLVTWGGSDHTSVFRGATMCIDEVALAYLTDGEVPPQGIECFVRGLMGIGYPDTGSVVINRVTPGSAADKGGVEVGDLVLSENGEPIESAADFIVGAAGEEVTLVVERGGEEIAITMTRGTPVWELWRNDE